MTEKTWLDQFREMNAPDQCDEDTSATEKTHKLDLFKTILPAIDRRDKGFFGRSTTDEQKEIQKQLWTLTRWVSSSASNSEHYMLMVNDIVNRDAKSFKHHPELLWQLLTLCGVGKSQKHVWISPPKGVKRNKVEEAIAKIFPTMKDDEIRVLLSINERETIVNLLRDNGTSDSDIKDMI